MQSLYGEYVSGEEELSPVFICWGEEDCVGIWRGIKNKLVLSVLLVIYMGRNTTLANQYVSACQVGLSGGRAYGRVERYTLTNRAVIFC